VAYEVAKRHLPTALLIFTIHESERIAGEVREAGAQGFVNKSCAGRDLIAAIEALLGGGRSSAGPSQPARPKGAVASPTRGSCFVGNSPSSRPESLVAQALLRARLSRDKS